MNNESNVYTKGDKKIFVSQEAGSVYWIEGTEIAFTPLNKDGTFDIDSDETSLVDEELVGEELVDFRGEKTYSQLYKEVREALA